MFQALTLVKTCEPVAEMRECRAPRDWSLLALQNIRTGKSHYLVICRCPPTNILGKLKDGDGHWVSKAWSETLRPRATCGLLSGSSHDPEIRQSEKGKHFLLLRNTDKYRVIQSSVQHLRILLGRSFGVENVHNFFKIRHRFRVTTFYIDVSLYHCGRLKGLSFWEFV
jgi:hypothetical protein